MKISMSNQCVEFTLKGIRCKRRVSGGNYCYQHSHKEKSLILSNVRSIRVSRFTTVKWNEPVRDATDTDVFIFERLVTYMNTPKDLLNLCLASREFAAKMGTNVFISGVYSILMRIYSIDFSKKDTYMLSRQLGCYRNLFPGIILPPIKLWGMIEHNIGPKIEKHITRSGNFAEVVVSGIQMLINGVYSGQNIIASRGTGQFIGFDNKEGYMWTYLDIENNTKKHSDRVASFWGNYKTVKEALDNNIIFLNEDENISDLY